VSCRVQGYAVKDRTRTTFTMKGSKNDGVDGPKGLRSLLLIPELT